MELHRQGRLCSGLLHRGQQYTPGERVNSPSLKQKPKDFKHWGDQGGKYWRRLGAGRSMWLSHLYLLIATYWCWVLTHSQSLGDRGPIFLGDYISRIWLQVLEKDSWVAEDVYFRVGERIYNCKFSDVYALRKGRLVRGLESEGLRVSQADGQVKVLLPGVWGLEAGRCKFVTKISWIILGTVAIQPFPLQASHQYLKSHGKWFILLSPSYFNQLLFFYF